MQKSDATTNFLGIYRLLFALLVIFSHSPEIMDGNRSREILTQIFGTLSFGAVAVDGFFVISGYLITGSFIGSRSVFEYLSKRVLRIYPGFLVAYLIAVLLVAPWSGASLSHLDERAIIKLVLKAALLMPPDIKGVFPGMQYAALNGSMWTIAYEFRCYLLIAIFGMLGFFKRPKAVAALLFIFLALLIIRPIERGDDPKFIALMLGNTYDNIRFGSAFLFGSVFYLYRETISREARYIWAAIAFMIVCLFFDSVAEPALIVFGGYIVLNTGLRRSSNWLASVTKEDVSYGAYLYAWPIQMPIIQNFSGLHPHLVSVISVFIAVMFGAFSWHAVEKHFKIKSRSC